MNSKTTNSILALSLVAGFNSSFINSADAAEAGWKINPSTSTMNFHLKNMGQAVDGKFGNLSGDVDYDGKDLAKATVKAKVETASIDTANEKRDEHLKTKDFFDAAKFPVAEFNSSKVVVDKSGSFKVDGKLNLHGVSQDVVLNAGPLKESTDAAGKKHLKADAKTTVLRKNFGIGGIMAATISDEVNIDLVIDLVK